MDYLAFILAPRPPILGCHVHTSPEQPQNTESSPPSPPNLGGTRSQSPPELGDLGGKNLRNETQKTYVYTVAILGEKDNLKSPNLPPRLASDPAKVSSAKERARRVKGAGDLGGYTHINIKPDKQETKNLCV